MRLIDADERRTEIDEEDRWVVDGAITVDAIPIEWIEHWKFTVPKYWEVVNGNDEIGRMLDDWRKENESNISD